MAITKVDDRGLNTPIDLLDNEKIRLGTGNDIEIYHNGTHSYLVNNTGTFYIRAKAGENSVTAYPDGGVKLAYDDNTKFETTSTGATVTGGLITTGNINVPSANSVVTGSVVTTNATALTAVDNGTAYFGTGNDLRIYHDGSHSYIKDAGTGTLRIEASEVGILSADGSETMAQFVQNGATSLRYDNSKKFETTSNGVKVSGIIDAQEDIYVRDNKKIYIGDGNDLQIFHDSSNGNTHLNESGSGSLVIKASNTIINTSTDEALIAGNADGSVQLYYDNVESLRTNSAGIMVQKTASSQNSTITVDSTNGGQAGLELKTTLSGTNRASRIDFYNQNTNQWTLINDYDQNGGNVFSLRHGAEKAIVAQPDSHVEIYHNSVKKIFTEGEGASVCGDGNDCHLRLRDVNDNVRGILHATASVDMGFITADATAWLFRVHDDGSYQHYGSEVSDKDRKDNITTISGTSLDKITKLVPKTFTYRQDETGKVPINKVFTGFIAQEVKEHLPSLVTGTDGQKNMGIDYNGILAHAVKAITELSTEIQTLKTKVAALEAA